MPIKLPGCSKRLPGCTNKCSTRRSTRWAIRIRGHLVQYLALAYHSAGRLEESAALLEEVLSSARERLGDDHPNTLSTMNSLVQVYRALNRFERVETLLKTIVELRQNKSGPNHPDTLTAEAALKRFYASDDR